MPPVVGNEQQIVHVERLTAFLRTPPAAPLDVIDKLGITALSDFRFGGACKNGLTLAVAIPVRRPHRVSRCCAAQSRISLELSGALWPKSDPLAERQSHALAHAHIDHSNSLCGWRIESALVRTLLSFAERGQPLDRNGLNEAFDSYRARERVVRVAFHEARACMGAPVERTSPK